MGISKLIKFGGPSSEDEVKESGSSMGSMLNGISLLKNVPVRDQLDLAFSFVGLDYEDFVSSVVTLLNELLESHLGRENTAIIKYSKKGKDYYLLIKDKDGDFVKKIKVVDFITSIDDRLKDVIINK